MQDLTRPLRVLEASAPLRSFREQEGDLACARLLEIGTEKRADRKALCDSMVRAAVDLVEKLTQK